MAISGGLSLVVFFGDWCYPEFLGFRGFAGVRFAECGCGLFADWCLGWFLCIIV